MVGSMNPSVYYQETQLAVDCIYDISVLHFHVSPLASCMSYNLGFHMPPESIYAHHMVEVTVSKEDIFQP